MIEKIDRIERINPIHPPDLTLRKKSLDPIDPMDPINPALRKNLEKEINRPLIFWVKTCHSFIFDSERALKTTIYVVKEFLSFSQEYIL